VEKRNISRYSVLSQIHSFANKDTHIMLKLYQSLVRPKLEYCVQAWKPYLKKDIEMLEKVQKIATQLMFRDKSFIIW